MVLESNQRHHEGPVLFALTQLAYSRQVLVSKSLNQLLHSIPQAPFPVGVWLPCRFTISTICSAGWIGYQLDDYGPSRPDSNRYGRGVEPLPRHRAAPCCARLSVLPLSRWGYLAGTTLMSNPEVSALGLIPGRPHPLSARSQPAPTSSRPALRSRVRWPCLSGTAGVRLRHA
jgi:hypothetical protein